ncbi:methionyl-tRNA formyltransferase [Ancylomarina euxinus]|uniref:Methionyl-tRNA formyltransferase n=1 Tax=Ancylomarina euxinus TaxID=2283627 RepID=A0A425Y5L7_9BACT|nr:methionyl-tRNA formyltransferase [Ancylomarina euxinus]MCZ4694279.1 methionyl-tRNA formyltransferase [Ancylomarina euxinus]MUP14390.1 methionyl-tRNA formyltransferase [Ancylomarina euxinus]RRG23700.1 methionyl-tRNA formyltransferase [Ancylomarina euxinus]
MTKNSLRLIYMGTPEFAVAPLDALIEAGCNVVGVITNPDKPAGRGQKIQESAVKKYALEKGLTILQPEKFRNETFLAELKALNADLQVVVAFKMLPEVVWNMPKYGTLNLHASLLPHYRGAAPINWAIMNGDKESGVSTFLLQKEIDTGNVIFQEKINIGENDNLEILHDNLMEIGSKLVVKTVRAIEANDYPQIPQDDLVTEGETLKVAPKIFKDDCKINWSASIENIHNHIRGLSPYPAAWTELYDTNGKKVPVKVYTANKEIESHSHAIGSLLSDKKTYLKVAVDGGFLNLTTIQMAGKKRMEIGDFLRGFQQIHNYKLLID